MPASLSAVYVQVFRDVRVPLGLASPKLRCLWIAAAVIQGALIRAVAIEFPYGSIVVGAYVIVLGLVLVGGTLYRRGDVLSRGNRSVLQYDVVSYIVALAISIGWAGRSGLTSNRAASGIAWPVLVHSRPSGSGKCAPEASTVRCRVGAVF